MRSVVTGLMMLAGAVARDKGHGFDDFGWRREVQQAREAQEADAATSGATAGDGETVVVAGPPIGTFGPSRGTLMSVAVGTDFPQPTASDSSAQPMFHLISLTAHTARISIVGGAYSNGAGSVTLRENRPLTLMNTADGTRYRLVLKPQGTPVSGTPGSGGSTTTPTVTLPAATP